MRKFGLIAVAVGVVGFAGPLLAQGCGGFFYTASKKQMTTAQSALLQSKPVEQDKKG